jgi:NitT/TauT family transport system substrate-binding protein
MIPRSAGLPKGGDEFRIDRAAPCRHHRRHDRGRKSMSMMKGLRVGALAAALTAGAAPLHAQALEDVTMAIPGTSFTFGAGYIAEDLGLWEKHGLRVKSIVITGIGAINSVISGSSTFAQPSASAFTRAAAKGQRLLAIAVLLNRPFVDVVLRNDLATAAGFDPKAPLEKRALALKGRTIAVESINSIVHAYVRVVANRGGYDPEEIRIAPMAPDAMLAAFQAKQIDGFAMSPPWPLKPVQEGTATMIASGPAGDPADMAPFGHNLLVTKPETCEKQRSVCEKMGRAFAEATAFIQSNPAEALAIMRKRFPNLDDRQFTAAFEEFRRITPSPPVPSKADLENAEIYNIQAGLMKPDEKLKTYDGLFTGDFVK